MVRDMSDKRGMMRVNKSLALHGLPLSKDIPIIICSVCFALPCLTIVASLKTIAWRQALYSNKKEETKQE